MKFGLSYILQIQEDDNSGNFFEIKYPFTINFDILKNISGSSCNQMTIQIYGLSKTIRNKIYHDIFDTQTYRKIILKAGYQNQLSEIFTGNIREAYSRREGSEIITYITAFDGDYAMYNSWSSFSMNNDVSKEKVFEKLANDLKSKNIQKGIVGDLSGSLTERGAIYDEKTFSLLKEGFNNEIFIDSETLNKLSQNEVFENVYLLEITSDNGLLATPRKQQNKLEIEMMFEPNIKIGQLISISSQINKEFDGEYKVIGFRSGGVISGTQESRVKTTLELYIPEGKFIKVKNYAK
jgi:hypothetical protein